MIRTLLLPFRYLGASRSSGLRAEVRFWDRWMKTRGLDLPDDFAYRMDPVGRVSPYHRRFLDRIDTSPIRILDVGAGPLTVIGKVYDRPIEITAVDPLADRYDHLLDRHGIHPPVRTIQCGAEALTRLFQENSFDFVNAENCLDHGSDPVEAVLMMIRVARPGGVVALLHEEDEAAKEGFKGLHQWNFRNENGDFVVTGKWGRRTNLSMLVRPALALQVERADNGRILAWGVKTGSAPP